MLAHIDALKPKEQKLLQNAADQARQSKYLATIVLDAPVQLDLAACRMTHVNEDRIMALFRQLEFRSLVERVRSLFRQLGITMTADGLAAPETPSEETHDEANAQDTPADDEENLLYAPPIGVVPVMTPPPPPGSEPITISHAAAKAGIAASDAAAQDEPAAITSEEADAPAQMSLFAAEEPRGAAVYRLRLPSSTTLVAPFLPERAQPSQYTNTMIVDSEEALRILIKSLYDAGSFALDTETTSEEPRHAQLVGISLAMAAGEAYYIPVGHVTTPDGQEPGAQLPLAYVLEKLRPLLEDAQVKKYMHNAKYDMAIFWRHRIRVEGLAFDSMVGAYLVEPGRRGGLGLKDQAFQRLNIVMTPITELIGSGSKMLSMAQVPIRKAADYAGADADMTLRLVEPILAELHQNNLLDLYKKVEQPLIAVLMQMELYGVALDADFLRQFGAQLDEQLGLLEQNIYDVVGHRFNINSTRQLADVLFIELKLPTGKKIKTGFSVSADVIEGLRDKHPIVEHLLAYRQLAKLKSTYVDGLLALMDPATGRVHTSFNQTIASSGRLSSSNPNLQNIPVRTELGRQLRRAFVADPSYVLLTADYAQFELRILASITGEPSLIEAFTRRDDIHTITAASLFSVPAEQVTRDQRRLAKTVVYAVLYGQSPFGLAQVTGMTNAEAAEFIKRYHETFPGVKGYVEKTLFQAHQQGYVNTIYGRKRFIPAMQSLSHVERQALEREAINMPIQGSNADLIKIAMLRLQHTLQERHMRTRMILQVHDELVFEVPAEELEHARRLVRSIMEGVGPLKAYPLAEGFPPLQVPIEVEIKVGRNWYEAEPME